MERRVGEEAEGRRARTRRRDGEMGERGLSREWSGTDGKWRKDRSGEKAPRTRKGEKDKMDRRGGAGGKGGETG